MDMFEIKDAVKSVIGNLTYGGVRMFADNEVEMLVDALSANIKENDTPDNKMEMVDRVAFAMLAKIVGVKWYATSPVSFYDFDHDLRKCIYSLPPLNDGEVYDMRYGDDIFSLPKNAKDYLELYHYLVANNRFNDKEFFLDFYVNYKGNTTHYPSAEFVDVCYRHLTDEEKKVEWQNDIKPLKDILDAYVENGLILHYKIQSAKENDGFARFCVSVKNDGVFNNLTTFSYTQTLFHEDNFDDCDGYLYFHHDDPSKAEIKRTADDLRATLADYIKVFGKETVTDMSVEEQEKLQESIDYFHKANNEFKVLKAQLWSTDIGSLGTLHDALAWLNDDGHRDELYPTIDVWITDDLISKSEREICNLIILKSHKWYESENIYSPTFFVRTTTLDAENIRAVTDELKILDAKLDTIITTLDMSD